MFNLTSPSYTYEEPAPLSPPPPPTLEELKDRLKQDIIYEASQRQEALIIGYSSAERNTWDRKESEATALLESGDIAQAKYLSFEAIAQSGASSEQEILTATQNLARIILAKADYLRSKSAIISGNRARLYALVDALASLEEANRFDYSSGWD